MKKIFTLAAVAACSMVGMAQNSVISKAAFLQEQNKQAEALEVLKSSFDNPKTTKFAEIYNQAGKLVSTQFNTELMKAANGQALDTAKFVSSLDEMVDYFTKSYVAEHTPNEKGKMPKLKFSPEDTRVLLGCQDYFFYAGVFLNQNHDKAGAYKYFNKHLQLVNNPALVEKRDSLLQAKAQNYAQASYYCSMLAYEMKKWDEVLNQTKELLDKKKLLAEAKIPVRDLYLMRFEANLTGKKDTLAYVNDLKHAIANLEDNQAFMESLVAVYNEKNDVAMANKAYCYINEVVTKRQNGGYKYAGSNLDRVKGQKAIDQYNKELKEIRGYFEKALPLMEKVRELAPERSRLWASALEQIYSNLNQKAKAEEMESIMRQGVH